MSKEKTALSPVWQIDKSECVLTEIMRKMNHKVASLSFNVAIFSSNLNTLEDRLMSKFYP